MCFQGQDHYLTLTQGHLHFNIGTSFSQIPLCQSMLNSIWRLFLKGEQG